MRGRVPSWIQSPTSDSWTPKSKTSPYDFGQRTPILVRWPKRVAPRRSEGLASSTDLFPTLLAAVGLPPEKGLPGTNLLDDRAIAAREHVFGECFNLRSLAINDPATNLLWRWETDGKWRLIVPRTYQAIGALATIPEPNHLGRDMERVMKAAEPRYSMLSTIPTRRNSGTIAGDLKMDFCAKLGEAPAQNPGQIRFEDTF